MAVAGGSIETAINDVRRWINDRNVNPTYTNSDILRCLAHAYDTVSEDVFTVPTDKPFMLFDLPLFEDQREYLLPTGMGHVYELSVLTNTLASTVVEKMVSAIIPCFNQDDVRGPGWTWNPPMLKFDYPPTIDCTIRVTFLPRAIDYLHVGLIADTAIRDTNYSNAFLITESSNITGNYKLQWKGVASANIAAGINAAGLKAILEAVAGITTVAVTGSPGALTVTFTTPVGIQQPFVVSTVPTTGSVTITAVPNATYAVPTETTLVLASSPSIGEFDPRPNAYIAGRLRIIDAGTPATYGAFRWIERDIIEYDPATSTVVLSSPLDFPVWATGTTVKYEILPMADSTMLLASAVEAARFIHSMTGNTERMAILTREYQRQITTARRQMATRNRARPISPTPKRYLRSRSAYGNTVISGSMTQAGDRFLLS